MDIYGLNRMQFIGTHSLGFYKSVVSPNVMSRYAVHVMTAKCDVMPM